VVFWALHEGLIDHLSVDPDYWRQGMGGAPLDRAWTLSAQHLWWSALQVNLNARMFSMKNGFVASKFGISPPPELKPDVEYPWKPK
jgi:GNAT superfamily N-acetyltransferase